MSRCLTCLLALGTLPLSAQFGALKGLLKQPKPAQSAPPAGQLTAGQPPAAGDEEAPEPASGTPRAAGASAVPEPWPTPTEAFIVPTSLRVTATAHACYQPTGKGDCKGSAWYPQVQFNLVGPLKQSTKLSVAWSAAGKPWFRQDLRTLSRDLEPGRVERMDSSAPVQPGWPALHTGPCGFRITAEDALAGTSRVLYEGSFTAGKHHTGNDSPMFKHQLGWFVSYDWALNLACLEFDTSQDQWPPLSATFWFRDPAGASEEFTGHLFHQGREVASTRGMHEWSVASESDFTKVRHGWSQVRFLWREVVGHDRSDETARLAKAHDLAAHPGAYTLKILRRGELVREATFTIRPDGRLDDGLTRSNQVRGTWTLLPAKVLGASDGAWDREAWQTGLLWGRALDGFQIPQ